MTIRQQICLGIIPLFLLIGLLINGAAGLLEVWEVEGDFERQGRALAVVLSENVATWIEEETYPGGPYARLDQAMLTLGEFDEIVSVTYWLDLDTPAWHWPEDDPPSRVLAEPMTEEPLLGGFLIDEHGVATMAAAAKTMTGSELPAGWVEVHLQDPGLGGLLHRLIGAVVWHGLAILALGVGLAFALAYLFKRDVAHLVASTSSVGGEAFRVTSDLRIREIAELSEVFHILDALIRESESTLVSRGADPESPGLGDANLIDDFRRRWINQIDDDQVAGRNVSLKVWGSYGGAGSWSVVVERSGEGILVCGKLAGPETLGTARLAHAAAEEFRLRCEKAPVDVGTILEELSLVYPLSYAGALQWTEHKSGGTRLRWQRGLDVTIEKWRGERVALHDQSEHIAELFELLVKRSVDASNQELLTILNSATNHEAVIIALVSDMGED